MRMEELLSQEEINALLDIADDPAENAPGLLKKSPVDALFEGIAKDVRDYLYAAGFPVDHIDILPTTPIVGFSCKHFEDKAHRLEFSVENTLSHAFIGVLFGGSADGDARALSSLEEKLLAPLWSTLQEIILRHCRSCSASLQGRSDDNLQRLLKLSFNGSSGVIKLSVFAASLPQKQPEKAPVITDQTQSVTKTVKVEAVIGTIRTERLVKGRAYRLDDYTFNEALLLVAERSVFRTAVLDNRQSRLTLLLDKPFSAPAKPHEYRISIAEKRVEVETLSALKKGHSLVLDLYPTAMIYQAGKIVAQAKVFVKEGVVVAMPL